MKSIASRVALLGRIGFVLGSIRPTPIPLNIPLKRVIAAFQVLAALAFGVCYYLIAMAMTVYDGVLSLLFQPIPAVILTVFAIGISWLAGLPIRLCPGLREWWIKHWWLSFVIGMVAFAMMCASWLPGLRIQVWNPDLESLGDSFHPLLGVGGWLLTVFAVLHFFPPFKWPRRASKNDQTKGGVEAKAPTRAS